MKNSCIKTWDEEERPREKLMLHGAASLTNTELLALLLRSGTSERSAVDLARELLAGSGGKLDTLSRRSAAGMAMTAGIGPDPSPPRSNWLAASRLNSPMTGLRSADLPRSPG